MKMFLGLTKPTKGRFTITTIPSPETG
ncbi:MAG: hypothetical protein ACLTAF_15435 [Blautia coccoides]